VHRELELLPIDDVWMDEADSEEEKVEEESYITGMDALFLSKSYFTYSILEYIFMQPYKGAYGFC
jgi:hypothetical protein